MHSCVGKLVHLSKTRCTSCKSPKLVKASLSSASIVVKGRLRKKSLPVGSSSSATQEPLLSLLSTTGTTADRHCCHCRVPVLSLLLLLSTTPISAATAEYHCQVLMASEHRNHCDHCQCPHQGNCCLSRRWVWPARACVVAACSCTCCYIVSMLVSMLVSMHKSHCML